MIRRFFQVIVEKAGRKWVVVGAVILTVLMLLYFFRFRDAADEPKIIAVEELRNGTVVKVLEATGIIKAQVGAIVKIGSRATGEISGMLVKVGDEVRKGDVIAEIDSREYRAQLDEAAARLELARADLAQAEEVYPLRIKEAEYELQLSGAKSEYADLNLGRQRKLAEKDIIARDVLDNAAREEAALKSEVAARRAAYERLRSEFSRERIKKRQALEQAEAAYEAARIKLSYTHISSPINGIVSQVTAQEGETVVAGLQVVNLITVLDPTRLEMWIYVDETDVGQVKPRMDVEFRVDAYPDKNFKGRIKTVYPQPEIRDNIVYYQALVSLDPEQSRLLRPEMTTHCRILVLSRENVPALPNQALKWVDGEQVVFVRKDNGDYMRVRPGLGLAGLTHTEVLSGLKVGDKVAVQVVLPGARTKRKDK